MINEQDDLISTEVGKSITAAFEYILEDSSLTEEFSKIGNIEEMYDFCNKVSGGYTLEEFKTFVVSSMKQVLKLKKGELEKILLEKITGNTTVDANNGNVGMLIARQLTNEIRAVSEEIVNGDIDGHAS